MDIDAIKRKIASLRNDILNTNNDIDDVCSNASLAGANQDIFTVEIGIQMKDGKVLTDKKKNDLIRKVKNTFRKEKSLVVSLTNLRRKDFDPNLVSLIGSLMCATDAGVEAEACSDVDSYLLVIRDANGSFLKSTSKDESGVKLYSELGIAAVKKAGHGDRLICVEVGCEDVKVYVPCALVSHSRYENIVNGRSAIAFDVVLEPSSMVQAQVMGCRALT